jgi:hypothetical protein
MRFYWLLKMDPAQPLRPVIGRLSHLGHIAEGIRPMPRTSTGVLTLFLIPPEREGPRSKSEASREKRINPCIDTTVKHSGASPGHRSEQYAQSVVVLKIGRAEPELSNSCDLGTSTEVLGAPCLRGREHLAGL